MIRGNRLAIPEQFDEGSESGYPAVSSGIPMQSLGYPALHNDDEPPDLSALDKPQLDYLTKSTRINAMTAVSLAQSSMAAAWLGHRNPWEGNIRIDLKAESRERGGFFGLFAKGEKLRVTTTINIW